MVVAVEMCSLFSLSFYFKKMATIFTCILQDKWYRSEFCAVNHILLLSPHTGKTRKAHRPSYEASLLEQKPGKCLTVIRNIEDNEEMDSPQYQVKGTSFSMHVPERGDPRKGDGLWEQKDRY